MLPNPHMDIKEDFQCLGHSNWAICSPLSPFSSENFPSFSCSYWGANSYYPRGPILKKGNLPNSRIGWHTWIVMPRVSCSPISPFLSKMFPCFSPSYWEPKSWHQPSSRLPRHSGGDRLVWQARGFCSCTCRRRDCSTLRRRRNEYYTIQNCLVLSPNWW